MTNKNKEKDKGESKGKNKEKDKTIEIPNIYGGVKVFEVVDKVINKLNEHSIVLIISIIIMGILGFEASKSGKSWVFVLISALITLSVLSYFIITKLSYCPEEERQLLEDGKKE